MAAAGGMVAEVDTERQTRPGDRMPQVEMPVERPEAILAAIAHGKTHPRRAGKSAEKIVGRSVRNKNADAPLRKSAEVWGRTPCGRGLPRSVPE